ncbi:NUDIX domain-containing protein [Pseudidiomarina planktonica]|uniref:NUDIX domain-containing protein n=1 Tax=Pseudidiomarina planktonica TaxID=1323738 RepID=A0A1Y6FX08_9GAMM|nr:NUDIX domain-containing protein [Pseudidiomarina planktonica]RUO63387.1 NUDIX domain-containing protein [Pseudidiomarina planktonica]SMQ80380.1 NUDIX domain-containing protein [Pseudidiomarina planktonica]
MRLLADLIHPSLTDLSGEKLYRQAVRGIVMRDDEILLLYTERYDDFSFPGGGVDEGESLIPALKRELQEETGVLVVGEPKPFGMVSEYQPYWKPQWPIMYQKSYWYQCEVALETTATKMEHYEIANGMRPQWVKLTDAINHNQQVLQAAPATMGLSIHRETHVLKQLAQKLALKHKC